MKFVGEVLAWWALAEAAYGILDNKHERKQMIEFTKAYKTSDGRTFGTLEEAQREELLQLLGCDTDAKIADVILDKSLQIVDILTTTATSKPKARRVNGGKKERKAKATAQPEAQP